MTSRLYDPLVHIVLPLYNEATILERTVRTLIDYLQESEFPYRYYITLADNASSDGSGALVDSLAKRYTNVRALHLTVKGKGHAVRAAWKADEGDILSFMDVDLASDLDFFKILIDGVARSGNDIMIGNRLGKRSVISDRRFHRELMSRFYNLLVRLFLRTGIQDHQCGFKAVRKDTFDAIEDMLTENGFFFDTELLAIARLKGFSIGAIDIKWNDKRESKVSFFSDSVRMFAEIIRLRIRINNHMVKP